MPAVSAPAKVLVTGASGFLGAHVVKALLDRGFAVRGTVRSTSKGEYLKKTFGNKFEYAIVPDMEEPNAYDNAVPGVEAVVHTASVVKMTTEHPDVIIKPSVAGQVNILESVKAHGSSVKRVIITSSIAAIGGLTEDQWNQKVVDAVNEKGINAAPHEKYSASKMLAEKAAWDFVEANKGKLSFDVVAINPPWIFGPMLHEGGANGSTQYLLGNVRAKKTDAELIAKGGDYIDVRDVAGIDADLLSAEGAGGQRYIASAGPFAWQQILDILNEQPAFPGVPKGTPGATPQSALPTPSHAKLLTLLGRSEGDLFRSLRETIRDAFASVEAKQ